MKRSPLKPPTREQIERYQARQAANMLRRAQARSPARRGGRKAEGPSLEEFRTVLRQRSGGWCEAVRVVRPRTGRPVCSAVPHPGVHAHHVVLRSQGGGNGPENGVWVCEAAHRWVHANPADARDLGLYGRRYPSG